MWALDVNERAVALCQANAGALGAPGVRALVAGSPEDATSAGMPATTRFDAIYSNPPIRVGKEALHSC